MKRSLCMALFSLFFFIAVLPVSVQGDTGPKPSVVIDFEGLEGKSYYVTLLSELPSTGPFSAVGQYPENEWVQEGEEEYEIWQAFQAFQDGDGFYFLQYFQNCSDTSRFTWGYYPPSKFKILVYFPEENSFVVSQEAYERYAFDSYFKVAGSGWEIRPNSSSQGLIAEKSYQYAGELAGLAARIVMTILIEVAIAIGFGYRAKKQLLFIGAINLLTQTGLNVLLNLVNYKHGTSLYLFNYFWLEAAVIFFEAFVYSRWLPKLDRRDTTQKWLPFIYAVTANGASFILGLVFAVLFPHIF